MLSWKSMQRKLSSEELTKQKQTTIIIKSLADLKLIIFTKVYFLQKLTHQHFHQVYIKPFKTVAQSL